MKNETMKAGKNIQPTDEKVFQKSTALIDGDININIEPNDQIIKQLHK